MKSFIKLVFKTIVTLAALAMLAYFGWKYAIPKLEQKESKQNKRQTEQKHQEQKHQEIKQSKSYAVKKVSDGDTFEIEMDGKKEKVRMLGIDTPERHQSSKLDKDSERTGRDKETIKKLGELAYKYVLKLIGGRKVILQSEPNGDDRDRYGRLLRYVYLEDGTFVNLKIVEDGYANAYRRFNLSKQSEFIEAEKQARENKRGLWGDLKGLEFMEKQGK
ncbi:MAG: thermonuclease family protein [Chlorobi bacterium]|nr:thermonuclease family protein [Chlorobiota bacterium]MCI0717027.1 thermonuclease family protein [Chlorobiota bacterium]